MAAIFLSGISSSQGAATLLKPDQIEFFEKRIRPVLARECYECHGPEKQKGGLRVDFREGLLKGGETGPAVVPGDPRKSLLIQAVTHENSEIKMPKKRPKLEPSTIDDLVAWVKIGAPDPRDKPGAIESSASWKETLATRKQWWSFQPVRKPSLPNRGNEKNSGHPVDAFINARLTEHGLQSATSADKKTLLRRLTFVLTGLPPTPKEFEQFEKDNSAEAYDRTVDRLLASPAFGETWARHWMDLVRFAETHGSEGDPEIPEAWRYRDYLIRAFNADVPWDQLIREQIAGDLLPNPRWNKEEGFNESILGIAQLRFVEHGFQPVDALDDQVRVVENQIDVLGKAFQGLTLACARCHDHKFDAISQRDFYALFGIFASCRPTQVTIDAPERLRRHREELTALKKEIRVELANVWTTAIPNIEANSRSDTPENSPEKDLLQRINALETIIADAEVTTRTQAFRAQRANQNVPVPIAAWSFKKDARDLVGGLHGEWRGGAAIKNGRLVLDGKDAFVRTALLAKSIREKTLEVWVTLSNLEQRGGGAISLERNDGTVFDSIVFGEQEAGKWMAGSDLFRRTRSVGGPLETASAGELIHLVAVYGADNGITLYRNGTLYGVRYVPEGDEHARLQTYSPGEARVLFGMRHTAGGNAFLAGAMEAACLYDRALSGEEVASSFRVGTFGATTIVLNKKTETDGELARERRQLEELRAEFQKRFPDYPQREAARQRWSALLVKATDVGNPLFAWAKLRDKTGSEFAEGWKGFVKQVETDIEADRHLYLEHAKGGWDLQSTDVTNWFLLGINPPEYAANPGEFSVQPEGERIIGGILPAGVYSHLLSEKHNGVLTSPRFTITTSNISVSAMGEKGARVRLVIENYPLGAESIYPQAELKNEAPGWVRLDTAYRIGAKAYLEFDPAEEVTSRSRGPSGPGGRSYFGVQRVVFHYQEFSPKRVSSPSIILIKGATPNSADDLAALYAQLLTNVVAAWRDGKLDEPERAFLDFFVRNDLLPNATNGSGTLTSLVGRYRAIEAKIPVARRSPGILETVAYDAPLLERGDHHKPLQAVARQYLEAFDSHPYQTKLSGRLELAREIATAKNPLTARVMVNRIWYHLFGRGLVSTVDNFGRLGEKPSNPELLDYLAAHFVEHGWSNKEMIRFLVTSDAFRRSSATPSRAEQIDPANELHSHMSVRRLEAEAVRDNLLAVSGQLDRTMYGPSVNPPADPTIKQRRSIYLPVRRTNLNPFLQVFDAPKPFTTLGRREPTNVPAQSLALLNDPFVIEMSRRWAASLIKDATSVDSRVREMFERAVGRPPTPSELEQARVFLGELAREHHVAGDLGRSVEVWQDFAQSLFNFKEFIYVR